jgi:hypothetical protein
MYEVTYTNGRRVSGNYHLDMPLHFAEVHQSARAGRAVRDCRAVDQPPASEASGLARGVWPAPDTRWLAAPRGRHLGAHSGVRLREIGACAEAGR